MRFIKGFLKWFFGILLVAIILLYITGYDYILKGIRVVYLTGHTTAFIDDAVYFENVTIPESKNPQPWLLHKDYNTVTPTQHLKETNKTLGTIAFLIIKNDSIWYENYIDEGGKSSQTNSFSMAKSIVSALLGKAIQDGYIKTLEQPVGDFYPQFMGTGMTVGDLSSMASGLNWDESYVNPFGVTAKAYYDDDIAQTILNLEVTETPGEKYKYLSGNVELLGMILEKATEKKLYNYLSESFWQPLGFTSEALWQVDDKEHKMVKAYCCIASNARDFARFGKLYKDKGKWNGKQVLDSAFVAKSIHPRFNESPQYGYGFWLSDYLEKDIFVMRGILGQFVITIPEDNLIIVRLGNKHGKHTEKPFTEDFYTYINEVYKMLGNN